MRDVLGLPLRPTRVVLHHRTVQYPPLLMVLCVRSKCGCRVTQQCKCATPNPILQFRKGTCLCCRQEICVRNCKSRLKVILDSLLGREGVAPWPTVASEMLNCSLWPEFVQNMYIPVNTDGMLSPAASKLLKAMWKFVFRLVTGSIRYTVGPHGVMLTAHKLDEELSHMPIVTYVFDDVVPAHLKRLYGIYLGETEGSLMIRMSRTLLRKRTPLGIYSPEKLMEVVRQAGPSGIDLNSLYSECDEMEAMLRTVAVDVIDGYVYSKIPPLKHLRFVPESTL